MSDRPEHSRPSDRLVDALNQARRTIERSLRLIAQAKAARFRATLNSDNSQLHRGERAAWAELLAGVPVDPDHIIVLCVRCRRVRTRRGWSALPLGIEEGLAEWTGASVSHGYCPECAKGLGAAAEPPSLGPATEQKDRRPGGVT